MVLPDGRRRAGDEVERRSRSTPRSSGAARCRPTARRPTSAPAIRGGSTRSTRRRRAARRACVTTLEAAWVTALAVRPDGTLIAGTTPGGRVYTIDPKSGKAKLFATLTAEHVWALALDAKSGTVYAGPAGPGKICGDRRRRPRRAPIWDSGDKHVVSLIVGGRQAPLRRHLRGGDPLQGRRSTAAPRRWPTSTPRRCARSRATGGVAVRRGQRLRATGGSGAPRRRAPPPRRAAPRSPAPPPARPPRRARCRARASARPRPRSTGIDPDGRMEQMFSIPDGYFTTLAFDEGGRALRRHRQRGARLPRVRRSHRRAGDRRAGAAGADAAARRQRLPGRHRRRGRHLPRRARRRRAGDLPVARPRRRVPVALGAVPLARHARRRDREPLRQHRQARRDLDRLHARSRSRARPRRAASARSPARPRATSSTARRSARPTGGSRR